MVHPLISALHYWRNKWRIHHLGFKTKLFILYLLQSFIFIEFDRFCIIWWQNQFMNWLLLLLINNNVFSSLFLLLLMMILTWNWKVTLVIDYIWSVKVTFNYWSLQYFAIIHLYTCTILSSVWDSYECFNFKRGRRLRVLVINLRLSWHIWINS